MIKSYEIARWRKKGIKAKKLFNIIKIMLFALLLYSVITSYIIQSYEVNSISMQPAFNPKDRVFSSPIIYGPSIPLLGLRFSGFKKPERGDIVIIIPPYYKKDNIFQSMIKQIIQFFSLNRAVPISNTKGKTPNKYIIKRIIGIPGDTIKMEKYIAYIKPDGSDKYFIENEMIKNEYKINANKDHNIIEWKNYFPFSGNVNEITLKDKEYFVLGDNRSESNDSISWGPLNYSHICDKVILRFWPLNKFETF